MGSVYRPASSSRIQLRISSAPAFAFCLMGASWLQPDRLGTGSRSTAPEQTTMSRVSFPTTCGQLRGEKKSVVVPKRHQIKHLGFFVTLVRDQEVDGSNPFAPTTSFRTNNLQAHKGSWSAWLWPRHSFFRSAARDQSFSSEFSVLRCEVRHTASLGLGKLSTRSRFWKKNQTASSIPVPCTEKSHQSGVLANFPDGCLPGRDWSWL